MTFPTVAQTITVEFLISGAWVNVTDLRPTYNCYVVGLSGSADNNPAVIIQRIKKSGLPVVTNRAQFTFFDPNAIMDNDNPLSPYYGRLPPGTNVRIAVDGVVRSLVALESVSPHVDNSPNATTVTVTCVGLFDINALGDKPLTSPIHRSTVKAAPVEYWRLEEGSGSLTFRSALPGGPSAVLTGTVSMAADSELGGSLPNPRMGADTLVQFPVRPRTYNGHWQVDFFYHQTIARPANTVALRVIVANSTIYYWDFTLGNNFQNLKGYDINGAVIVDSGGFATPTYITAGWVHFRLGLHDEGGGVMRWLFNEFPVPLANGNFFTGTFSGTYGQPYVVQILSPLYQTNPATSTLDGVAYGHMAVYDDYNFSAVDASGQGYSGERAADRFLRICSEEGIAPANVVGNAGISMPMGAQPVDTKTNILVQCAAADGGMIYEPNAAMGLTYRTRLDMYTQAPALRLAYNQSHLSKPLMPVTGGIADTTIQNDITADRPRGGNARYVVPDGDFAHWTTEAPPNGVTARDGKITVNVSNDDYLNEIAAWVAHLNSWKDKRFAEITVDRHRRALAADPVVSNAIWSADIMQLLAVDTTGASRWLPPLEARALMEGRTDYLAQFGHKTIFNTRPADPYEVAQVNTSGSTLAIPMTTATTSIKIDNSLGPAWSENDVPYHMQIDGEAMRVIAITTDTPTFIAVGAAAHANNASVTPGLPAGMTPDVGQLMILHAAIRNSGAGTVNTPAGGWSVLRTGNQAVFAKYYQTGDPAPTVTFTGGVVNADTSACITAWAGLSRRLGSSSVTTGKQSPVTADQLNGAAAQNVAYPDCYVFRDKCVVMVFGWKQDDWTSVAAIAGMTEAYEAFTILGDDQGIVMDYVIQGAKANVVAGALVVTGGLAAISRTCVVALRPLQSVTVVRNQNNVNVTHAVGAFVRGWRMGVNGL